MDATGQTLINVLIKAHALLAQQEAVGIAGQSHAEATANGAAHAQDKVYALPVKQEDAGIAGQNHAVVVANGAALVVDKALVTQDKPHLAAMAEPKLAMPNAHGVHARERVVHRSQHSHAETAELSHAEATFSGDLARIKVHAHLGKQEVVEIAGQNHAESTANGAALAKIKALAHLDKPKHSLVEMEPLKAGHAQPHADGAHGAHARERVAHPAQHSHAEIVEHKLAEATFSGDLAQAKVYAQLVKQSQEHAGMEEHKQKHAKITANGAIGGNALERVNVVILLRRLKQKQEPAEIADSNQEHAKATFSGVNGAIVHKALAALAQPNAQQQDIKPATQTAHGLSAEQMLTMI